MYCLFRLAYHRRSLSTLLTFSKSTFDFPKVLSSFFCPHLWGALASSPAVSEASCALQRPVSSFDER